MVVKIYCDICGAEIAEASEDEGWDVGKLKFRRCVWQDITLEEYFDFDALCEKCTGKIKAAIETAIKFIRKDK